jgi:hypothetical protein
MRPASFAGLDELTRMKRAADRPKDLDDLRVLLSLKERSGESTGGKSA